jgi:hypothetical protein
MNVQLATRVTSAPNVLMLAVLLGAGAGLAGSMAPTKTSVADMPAPRVRVEAPQAVAAMAPGQAVSTARIMRPTARPTQEALHLNIDSRFDQLRKQMRWLPIKYGSDMLETPDAPSRILLARSAARQAGLVDVGLSYRDVYGIINAETSWIPRMGASKDGTPNLGIAQFEPATARAVGLVNPADPVEAVHAAAAHMKEAALWSARRIAGLELTPAEHALKLREGVSIYYNLSTRGRNRWDGKNTAKLPVETLRHISNARTGALEAAELDAQLRELKGRMSGERTLTAQR